MTRAEIEQLLAQQERELAAFVEQANKEIAFRQGQKAQQERELAALIEQANKEIAFRQGQIAALAMVLQTPPPQEEPAQAE